MDFLKHSPGFALYLDDRAEETNAEIRGREARGRVRGEASDAAAERGAQKPTPENPSSA